MTQSMQANLPVSWKKQLFQGVALFLVLLTALLCLMNTMLFSDEFDNFVGGMLVAAGDDVYQVHTSQHMPFMYYLCSIFRLLGATNAYTYRLGFYAFLALLWSVMYIRYSKHFGKVALIFYPILYIFEMAFTSLAPAVLADHMQAQGMVILLLEFMVFIKQKELKLSNCIWISLAIVFSYGSVFLSAYAIFVMAVFVFLSGLLHSMQKPRDLQASFPGFLKQLGILALIILAPFALLTLWYGVTGNLENFYMGAYKINVSVYSKYTGGFGENPLSLALTRPIDYYNNLIDAIKNLTAYPETSVHALILFAGNIAFVLWLAKKNILYALGAAAFLLANGVRGFNGFHAMAYLGVSAGMISLLFGKAFRKYAHRWGYALPAAAITVAGVLGMTFFYEVPSIIEVPALINLASTQEIYSQAIQKITTKEDRIHVTTLATDLYLNADRLPLLSAPSSVPWMYEVYGEKEVSLLKKYMPKAIFYAPDWEVWGYYQEEYAPELSEFIWENYSIIEGADLDSLFIRNDYLEEAKKLLNIRPVSIPSGIPKEPIAEFTQGKSLSQVFTATGETIYGVSVMIAAAQDDNDAVLSVALADLKTGAILTEAAFDSRQLANDQYAYVDLPYALEIGAQYELRFTVEFPSPNKTIALYRTATGVTSAKRYTVLDGVNQTYNLCFNLYGE